MVKKVNSLLLDRVLLSIERGSIRAKDNSIDPELRPGGADGSASADLRDLYKALKMIRMGMNVEVALEIDRKRGPGSDVDWPLVNEIHRLRQDPRSTKETIELEMRPWFESQGRKPLSGTRLLQIYKKHGPGLEFAIAYLQDQKTKL